MFRDPKQKTFGHRPIDKAAKPPPSCLFLRKVRTQHHEATQLPPLYFAVRSAVFAPMREIRSSGESTTWRPRCPALMLIAAW